jgi:hypothetical protein
MASWDKPEIASIELVVSEIASRGMQHMASRRHARNGLKGYARNRFKGVDMKKMQ